MQKANALKMAILGAAGAAAVFGVCVTVGSLVSPKTPILKEYTRRDGAIFLREAAKVSEREMGMRTGPGGGYAYRDCMQGKPGKVDCTRLYEGMGAFAKTRPGFQGLTVREIADPMTWARVGEDYRAVLFNTLPDEE